jgi:hypothetical protein
MKVTIEFDSVSDRDVLEAVLSSLPTRPYSPPEYIHVVAPPPAAPLPPVEPMAVPVEEKYIPVAADTVSPAPAEPPPRVTGEYGICTPPVDADGLPWDGRIHSSSKALLVDGKWRQRRNTDPAVVAAVTAELRAALGAPAVVPQPPPVTVAPFVPENIPLPVPLAVVPPPPMAVFDAPSCPSTDPALNAPMTFPEFMKAITAARIPPGTVLDACKAVGMPSIPALNQRPDLIPTVAAALGVS